MKALVAYYSLTGNTERAAKSIAKGLDADLIQVLPNRDIPKKGFLTIPLGVLAVMTGRKPPLKDMDKLPADYDTIIVGTPVWAGHYAPTMRSYLDKFDFSGKNVGFFATCGSEPGVTFEKMKQFVGDIKPLGTLTLTSKEENWDGKIDEWVKAIMSKLA